MIIFIQILHNTDQWYWIVDVGANSAGGDKYEKQVRTALTGTTFVVSSCKYFTFGILLVRLMVLKAQIDRTDTRALCHSGFDETFSTSGPTYLQAPVMTHNETAGLGKCFKKKKRIKYTNDTQCTNGSELEHRWPLAECYELGPSSVTPPVTTLINDGHGEICVRPLWK